MTGFDSAKGPPPSKSPDDHRRQHAAMNHDTTRAVVKLLRHLGYDADADALEAAQALVWQPVTMRTAPGELVEGAAVAPKPQANANINRTPIPRTITAADYDGDKAPDVMALAAKQRAEKNADRRLPKESDE